MNEMRKLMETLKKIEESSYKLNKNGECAFCKGEGFDPRDETYGNICPACDGEISPEMGKMMKRIRVKGDGVYNATAPGEDPKINY